MELVHVIRQELNLTRGVPPKLETAYEHNDGSLHLVVCDRAEKSLLLGPGGRIAAELAKRTGRKITIYGADEILLRKHRLRLTLSRIEEVAPELTSLQSQVLNCLRYLIEQELSYPNQQIHVDSSIGQNLKVSLAFSGGIDSTAAAMILKESGIIPIAVMVRMDHQFQNPRDIKLAEEWCAQQDIILERIDTANEFSDLVDRVDLGRIHPCGECHSLIIKRVSDFALQNNYEVLVTGELLPSGRQAIVLQEGLLIIHLPAALSLSKHRTEIKAEKSGKQLFRRKFGCNLVAKSHCQGWRTIGPSIFRVLRELEGGILTTGQGLDYIKDIVSSSARERGE